MCDLVLLHHPILTDDLKLWRALGLDDGLIDHLAVGLDVGVVEQELGISLGCDGTHQEGNRQKELQTKVETK